MSAGKGMAPTKGYHRAKYRANYDQIFGRKIHGPSSSSSSSVSTSGPHMVSSPVIFSTKSGQRLIQR